MQIKLRIKIFYSKTEPVTKVVISFYWEKCGVWGWLLPKEKAALLAAHLEYYRSFLTVES
jgi:hypothetical protein